MAIRRSSPFLIGILAALSGCGPGAPGNNSSEANAAVPPPDSLEAQPVKEEHKALALTPAWLAGRWQTDDGNCGGGDTFFSLSPDGGYSYMGDQGRWSLQGSTLTVELTQVMEENEQGGGKAGDRHATQVRPIGPNEAEFRGEDGTPVRMFRCHEAG
jgi:hypothetical protein